MVSLNEIQLAKVLTALNAFHSGSWNWWQVVPVFVSAFLAMVVGILLDLYKGHREKVKSSIEKQGKEVRQINVAIAGIAFNIESLLHIVFQNILPHHKQSHEAYRVLRKLLDTNQDSEHLKQFAISLHKYPALMMTCPEMHFIECDFLKELPFIIEKDPELLKQSGWLISHSREINNAIMVRNKNIEAARSTTTNQSGILNSYQIDSVLQLQTSISNKECVVAFQFFELFLSMDKNLERINDTYNVPVIKSKLIPPEPLKQAMRELKQIADEIIPNMPT